MVMTCQGKWIGAINQEMARQPRVEYPGAYYHVMSRGDRRKRIFQDDEDRQGFLKILEETCARCGWEVVSWVLMGNHFHLQIHTPEPNLVTGMKWMLGTYTIRFNRRHHLTGHLFQGRYKAIPIEVGDYLLGVSDYIHMNPVRSRLVDWEQGGDVLKSYRWSSYLEIAGYRKPGLCAKHKARLLRWCGLDKEAHRAYRRRMGQLALQERKDRGKGWKELRQGWYLGEKAFANKLLESAGKRIKGKHRASYEEKAVERHDVREAERLVVKALRKLKVKEAELVKLPKSAVEKQAVAWLARTRTTVDRVWLARRLRMGHPNSVTHAVRRMQQPDAQAKKLVQILELWN
jgi:REP element-mobilizing transposase RayT